MKVRLYYWIRGAPSDRPGGPWWYRDFKISDGRELKAFLGDLKPFLHKAYRLWGDLPKHDSMHIEPPSQAREVELETS